VGDHANRRRCAESVGVECMVVHQEAARQSATEMPSAMVDILQKPSLVDARYPSSSEWRGLSGRHRRTEIATASTALEPRVCMTQERADDQCRHIDVLRQHGWLGVCGSCQSLAAETDAEERFDDDYTAAKAILSLGPALARPAGRSLRGVLMNRHVVVSGTCTPPVIPASHAGRDERRPRHLSQVEGLPWSATGHRSNAEAPR
jgi:hypothetical protein